MNRSRRRASRDGFQASEATTASIVPGAFPSGRLFTNRNAGFFRCPDFFAIGRIPSLAPHSAPGWSDRARRS